MDTNEYLFKRTVQNLQDEKDRQRAERQAARLRKENALNQLADKLEFLTNYGMLIDRKEIKSDYSTPLLKIRKANNIHDYLEIRWDDENYRYYRNWKEENYYNSIDDIIVEVATCYQNKTKFNKLN